MAQTQGFSDPDQARRQKVPDGLVGVREVKVWANLGETPTLNFYCKIFR